jgi:hypothetical protein
LPANLPAYHAPRPGIENDGNIDEASGDGDVGDVCPPELVGPVRDDIGGEIGEDRLIVIAIRCRYEAAAGLRLKIVLAHQPADLLVVDDQALLTESGSDATPAVVFELLADGGHRLDDCCIVGRMRRVLVEGRAGKSHQSAPLGDADALGPAIADMLPLLGTGPGRRAPFRNSRAACVQVGS